MDDQAVLQEAFTLIESYFRQNEDPEIPVVDYRPPSALREEFNVGIGPEGVDNTRLVELLEEYLRFSVRTGSRQFFNQLYGGQNLPAFLGDVFTSLTNTSMYTYEVAPLATLMERELVRKMGQYAGFENCEGTFVTGGSNTNLIAMICARNQLFPEVKVKGTWGMAPISLFVSDQSHYSFSKGANAIGIGMQHVIKVASDELGQMKPDALDAAIRESKARGEQPFFVGATTATTELGAFDPLEAIGEVAREHGLWFHVDGSWGASIILSEKQRYRFRGLEKANSFSWNPHKMMNIPLICSVVLINDTGVLYRQLSTKDTDYIFHDNENAACDLGPASLQCGKRVDSLKLWLAWKYHGDHGYAQRIDHLFDLAQYATAKVEAHPSLELLAPTQTLNVNFRYVTEGGDDLNTFNETLRELMLREGKSMVNYCRLNGKVSIRLILVNPDVTTADIDRFFDIFLEAAARLEAEAKVPAGGA